jgi:hypothetical protein
MTGTDIGRPPVKRLRAVDVGNAAYDDFELHIDRFDFCGCHDSSSEVILSKAGRF